MNFRRFKRLDFWIIAIVAALPLFIAAGSFAQAQRVEQATREQWRLERKVDGLETAYSALQLEIEKRLGKLEFDMNRRLTTLETYATAGLWMLGLVAAAAIGQVTMRVVDRIRLHPAQTGKDGKA